METVLVACKTLEDELSAAKQATGTNYETVWIESGLHDVPNKLTARLIEVLGCISADRVLLAMGFCGNSVQGIRAGSYELIIPRVDDCISLLLGSIEARAKVSDEYAAYFLTEGWMRGERNLWVEYQYTFDKYGEEKALHIAEMMFGHYRTLGLLDTGIAPIEPLVESTRIIAETLKLEQKIIPASVGYLELLLTGPWPADKFLVKSPGEEITLKDLLF